MSITVTVAKVDWVDILDKLVWTFVEGFLGSLPVISVIADLQTEHLFANAAIIGGGGAVVSFLKNFAKERLAVRRSTRL